MHHADDNPYSRPHAAVAEPIARRHFWIAALPVAVVAALVVPLLIAGISSVRGGSAPAFLASPGFIGSLLVAAVAAAATVRILDLPRWGRYALAPLLAAGLMVVLSFLRDVLF
ncbi:hypothetical protein GCM10027188_00710 [Lysobacter humi (ex Lee et al. 2017)]